MRLSLVLALGAGLAGPAYSEAALHGYFEIPRLTDDLGGLSAIEVSPDGQSFWMLNDAGQLFTGTFVRDASNNITHVQDLKQGALSVPPQLKAGLKVDSEGLAVDQRRQINVSFEGAHRVLSYRANGRVVDTGPYPPEIDNLPKNQGLEALAVSKSGTLFGVPEYQDHASGFTPVYSLTTAGWVVVLNLPNTLGFWVTGADGLLYIVERRKRLFGFQNRVRRIDLAAHTVETVLRTPTGQYDNLEGIALWPAPQGGQIITLVSDNNFLPIFPNQVVEFHIAD